MQEFTINGFLAHTAALIHETEKMQHHLLEKACKAVEAEAKAEIGHYQPASGPFPAWAPLAAATIERKGADDPLLRTAAMQASIDHSISGHVGTVGSNDPAAVYQELGTSHNPARSFLGGAAHRLAPGIAAMVGMQYALFLSGKSIYNMRADIAGGALSGEYTYHQHEEAKFATGPGLHGLSSGKSWTAPHMPSVDEVPFK